MSECDHDWVRSRYLLLTNPPRIRQICKLCGEKDEFSILLTEDKETYEQVNERFNRENKKEYEDE